MPLNLSTALSCRSCDRTRARRWVRAIAVAAEIDFPIFSPQEWIFTTAWPWVML